MAVVHSDTILGPAEVDFGDAEDEEEIKQKCDIRRMSQAVIFEKATINDFNSLDQLLTGIEGMRLKTKLKGDASRRAAAPSSGTTSKQQQSESPKELRRQRSSPLINEASIQEPQAVLRGDDRMKLAADKLTEANVKKVIAMRIPQFVVSHTC